MSSESSLKAAKNDFGIDGASIAMAIAIAVATLVIASLFTGSAYPSGGGMMMGSVSFAGFSALLNIINVFLLAYLLAQYIYMYRRIASEFTLGLIVLAYVLLAHSILANPLLFTNMMGYGYMGGALSFVPTLLTTTGALVLLYLNSK